MPGQIESAVQVNRPAGPALRFHFYCHGASRMHAGSARFQHPRRDHRFTAAACVGIEKDDFCVSYP